VVRVKRFPPLSGELKRSFLPCQVIEEETYEEADKVKEIVGVGFVARDVQRPYSHRKGATHPCATYAQIVHIDSTFNGNTLTIHTLICKTGANFSRSSLV
jgi:hypothetical protein